MQSKKNKLVQALQVQMPLKQARQSTVHIPIWSPHVQVAAAWLFAFPSTVFSAAGLAICCEWWRFGRACQSCSRGSRPSFLQSEWLWNGSAICKQWLESHHPISLYNKFILVTILYLYFHFNLVHKGLMSLMRLWTRSLLSVPPTGWTYWTSGLAPYRVRRLKRKVWIFKWKATWLARMSGIC